MPERHQIFTGDDALDRAVAAAANGIVIADAHLPDCPLVYVNAAFLHMTGYTEVEVIGRNCRFLQGPDTDPAAVEELREAVRTQRPCQTLILNYRKDGMAFWNEVTVSPVRDERGVLTHFVGIQTDVTARQGAEEARRRAEDDLRRSREDLRLAIDAARLGTFYCDYPLDKITWNDTCKAHFFLPPDAEVDFALFYSLIHPNDREPTRRAIEQALAEHTEYNVEYRALAVDGRTRWINAVGRFHYDPAGDPTRFDGVTLDISGRKAAEEELHRRAERERFLAGLTERTQRLSDPDAVIADAVQSVGRFLGVSRCIFADIDIEADTCTIRPDYRADETIPSIAGVVSIAAFGPFVVAEYAARRAVAVDDVRLDPVKAPPETLAAYEAIGIRAHVTVPVVHTGRVVSCLSVHNAAPRHWGAEEVDLLRAVVERTWLTVEVLRQQRALAREAEERREAHERTAAILESITDAFYAIDREWRFTYLNTQAERLLFRTREGLLGRGIWDEFPQAVGGTFHRLFRQAMDEGVAVSVEDYYAPPDSWMDVRVYPSADGISVFFQNVSERKRAEEERGRMLEEQRARAEREALLGRIGLALRGSPDPENVLETAVRELGRALGADRCYFASYDQDADAATVGPDWHRDGLPSLAGRYAMSRYGVNRDPEYQAGRTQVVPDMGQDKAMTELGLRALVRVPLVSGVSMTALAVAMANGPRDWTADEVALVEAVATQAQTALEAVRVQRREHRIAEQLQAALQPELPQGVAGLTLARYYEAALEEAGVGGDFYDVFAIEKGRTALVVGDLSGKGLAAAAQVATVRNMLRAFLYSQPTVARAVSELNRTLAENNLLAGFTTLFVGAYDSGRRVLNYVNCGQEPGLLRRGATGAIEQLSSTGPVLGSFENAQYAEAAVTLAPGDALALFTDGLTEVGSSRTAMLGIEGVTALFERPVAARDIQDGEGLAEHLALRLIEGVDQAAQGGVMRDDMCLLVAVVESGGA